MLIAELSVSRPPDFPALLGLLVMTDALWHQQMLFELVAVDANNFKHSRAFRSWHLYQHTSEGGAININQIADIEACFLRRASELLQELMAREPNTSLAGDDLVGKDPVHTGPKALIFFSLVPNPPAICNTGSEVALVLVLLAESLPSEVIIARPPKPDAVVNAAAIRVTILDVMCHVCNTLTWVYLDMFCSGWLWMLGVVAVKVQQRW